MTTTEIGLGNFVGSGKQNRKQTAVRGKPATHFKAFPLHCLSPSHSAKLESNRAGREALPVKSTLQNEKGRDRRPTSQRFCPTSYTVKFYCVRRRTKSLRNGPSVGEMPLNLSLGGIHQ